jgi:hypothetical protein
LRTPALIATPSLSRRNPNAFVEIGRFHHLDILEQPAFEFSAEGARDELDPLIIEARRLPELTGMTPLRLDAQEELQRLDAIRPDLEIVVRLIPTTRVLQMIKLSCDHLRVGAEAAHLLGQIVLDRVIDRPGPPCQAPRGAF